MAVGWFSADLEPMSSSALPPKPSRRLPHAAPLSLAGLARRECQQALVQFTQQLHRLLRSDEAEVVHQARVAWRRFKSLVRLFQAPGLDRDRLALAPLPDLLDALAALRDVDVAGSQTLPAMAAQYTDADAARNAAWEALSASLWFAAALQREAVRDLLARPDVQAALKALAADVAALPARWGAAGAQHDPKRLSRWAVQRLTRLQQRLALSLTQASDAPSQHRARILAKRLRYGIEALRPLLSARRFKAWHQQALALQTDIGAQRDRQQALRIAEQLGADAGLLGYLRGYVRALDQAS